MKQAKSIPTRIYSFLIPACIDGMLGLVQTAVPLLALRFAASALFLGMLGGLPQGLRFIISLKSGQLSDRVGRTRVIFPATAVLLISCLGLAIVQNRMKLLLVYAFLISAVGAFYPSLQAFIGDHSPYGELRKNLASFNAGWATGGAITAVAAGFIFAVGRMLPFTIGAALLLAVMLILMSWSRTTAVHDAEMVSDATVDGSDEPNPLLLIARIGHFLGFFGFSTIRNIYPKLATQMHMSEGTIGLVVGIMLVGQALGMLLISAGPWWRGKLWPILFAQTAIFCVGLTIYFAESKWIIGGAMLILGMAQVIPYTCSLYYGMQSRTNMGRNTGIHESLVAASIISGSLLGGVTAQYISLRAPYILVSGMAFMALSFSLVYWRSWSHKNTLSS